MENIVLIDVFNHLKGLCFCFNQSNQQFNMNMFILKMFVVSD